MTRPTSPRRKRRSAGSRPRGRAGRSTRTVLADAAVPSAKLNAEKAEADVAAVKAAEDKFQSRRRASATPGNVDPVRATPGELRDGALVAIERAQNRLSSDQQDHLEKLVRESTENRDAATVPEWMCITEAPAYRSAFWKAMQYEYPAWTPQEGRAVRLWQEEFRSEVRAATEAGSFGLAIPATIDPSIVPSAGELAPILNAAHMSTVTTNVYKGVSVGRLGVGVLV